MSGNASDRPRRGRLTPQDLDWMKSLYRSILEEPIPERFRDLLKQLDEPEDKPPV